VTRAAQKALSAAKASVARLRRERRELAKRDEKIARELAEWQKVIDAFSATLEVVTEELPEDVAISSDDQGISPQFTLTFTNGVRYALETSRHLTVPEIRDILVGLGFDFSKYKQELVPIHNTLKRLEEQGEARRVETRDSRRAWTWVSPLERARKEMREIETRRSVKPQQKE
jgi:hypothetical protein